MDVRKDYFRKVIGFSDNTLFVTIPTEISAFLGIKKGDNIKIFRKDKQIIMELISQG